MFKIGSDMPPCVVTTTENATEPVRFAVDELRRYLGRILGTSIPVEASDGAPRIRVGVVDDDDLGVARAAEVVMDGKIADESGVEVCRLVGDAGVMYVVLNHNEFDVSFDLRIREETDGWFNLEDGERVDLDAMIELPPLGVLAFAKCSHPQIQ